MRFIRKNGRVIPINDSKEPSKIIRIESGLRHATAQGLSAAAGYTLGRTLHAGILGKIKKPSTVVLAGVGTVALDVLAQISESSANKLVKSSESSQKTRKKLMGFNSLAGALVGLSGKRITFGKGSASVVGTSKKIETVNKFAKIMRDNKVKGWWPHTHTPVTRMRWEGGRPHWGG